MSQDGLFFKQAATLNSNAVPARALWHKRFGLALCVCRVLMVICLTIRLSPPLLFYILTIGGLFVLRQREPDAPRPYKALGYPVLPIIYILAAGAICVNLLIMQPQAGWYGTINCPFRCAYLFSFEKWRRSSDAERP